MRKIYAVIAMVAMVAMVVMMTSVAEAVTEISDTQFDISSSYLGKTDGEIDVWHAKVDASIHVPFSGGCVGLRGIGSAETGYDTQGRTDDNSKFLVGIGYRCLPNQDDLTPRGLFTGHLGLGKKYHWGDVESQDTLSRIVGAGIGYDFYDHSKAESSREHWRLRQTFGASASVVSSTDEGSDYDIRAYYYLFPYAATSYKVVAFMEGRGSDESRAFGGEFCRRLHFQTAEICLVAKNREGSIIGTENGWEAGGRITVLSHP